MLLNSKGNKQPFESNVSIILIFFFSLQTAYLRRSVINVEHWWKVMLIFGDVAFISLLIFHFSFLFHFSLRRHRQRFFFFFCAGPKNIFTMQKCTVCQYWCVCMCICSKIIMAIILKLRWPNIKLMQFKHRPTIFGTRFTFRWTDSENRFRTTTTKTKKKKKDHIRYNIIRGLRHICRRSHKSYGIVHCTEEN